MKILSRSTGRTIKAGKRSVLTPKDDAMVIRGPVKPGKSSFISRRSMYGLREAWLERTATLFPHKEGR